MGKVRAFIVTDVDDEECDVVAAATPGQAKAKANLWADFTDRRVRRFQEADPFIKDGELNLTDLFLADLIPCECSQCCQSTWAGDGAVVVHGAIFCPGCAAKSASCGGVC